MYCFYYTEQRGDSITELREQLDRIKSSMLFVAQTVCSSVMFDYAVVFLLLSLLSAFTCSLMNSVMSKVWQKCPWVLVNFFA